MSEKTAKDDQLKSPGNIKKATTWLVSPRVFIKQEDMRYGIFTLEPIKRLFENISDSVNKLKKQRALIKKHGKVRTTKFSTEEIEALKEQFNEKEIDEITHHTFNYDTFQAYIRGNNITLQSIRSSHDNNALWGYISMIIGGLLLLTGTLTLAGLIDIVSPLNFVGKVSGVIMLVISVIQFILSSHRFYHAKLIEKKLLPERVSYNEFLRGKIGRLPAISLSEEFDKWYLKNV